MSKRVPPPVSASWLAWHSQRYLERWFTSSAHLRRLLLQRAMRSVEAHGSDPAEAKALVDAEITRLITLGALDDDAYARDKAQSLHRKGRGAAKIRQALGAKGLGGQPVTEALAALRHDDRDPEMEAARTFARKRRIGPWRTGPDDAETRRKELGKLARAGFSYSIARRALDTPDDDAISDDAG